MATKPKTPKAKKPKQTTAKQTKPKATAKHQRPAPKPEAALATAVPVVAKTPKPVTPPKGSALPPMKATDVITAVKACPYKPGTKSADNYARYKVGMTVGAALTAGVPRDYLAWDRRYGHLTVTPDVK
jgi:hypothetical protein